MQECTYWRHIHKALHIHFVAAGWLSKSDLALRDHLVKTLVMPVCKRAMSSYHHIHECPQKIMVHHLSDVPPPSPSFHLLPHSSYPHPIPLSLTLILLHLLWFFLLLFSSALFLHQFLLHLDILMSKGISLEWVRIFKYSLWCQLPVMKII